MTYNLNRNFDFFKGFFSYISFSRFATIVCSLITLKYVAVSFSETIKSSAPIFTAIIAWLMLGEYLTDLYQTITFL